MEYNMITLKINAGEKRIKTFHQLKIQHVPCHYYIELGSFIFIIDEFIEGYEYMTTHIQSIDYDINSGIIIFRCIQGKKKSWHREFTSRRFELFKYNENLLNKSTYRIW